MLSLVAGLLSALVGAPRLWAQSNDIAGIWQGTLDAGKSLRLVLKIQKADDGGYKAQLFSIDQGGSEIPVNNVKLNGASIKLSLIAIGGSYDGRVLPDGSEIEGTWSQGGNQSPLNLKQVTEATMWTIPAPPPRMEPMAKGADPAFEVATIKPAKPDEEGKYLTIRGTEFKTANFSLADLIAFAYGVHGKQIVNAPAWVDTEKWDISGKPDTPGAPNEDQLKSMLKKLLVERFQLKFHEEKKVLSVYALAPGRSAPKLTKANPDAGSLPGLFFAGLGKLNVRNATMGNFCHLMQEAVLDRPVVDQTKLEGRWDFTLNWTPDESQFAGMKVPPPSDKADAPPPLFTAVQEQLGLKLEPTRAEVGVLAVDKVERPIND